jgi:hypothetical protein
MARARLISTQGPWLELLEPETWESIFASNPGNKIGLEPISGWSYRAFGRVISIAPVIVDCGLLRVEGVVHTHDPSVIGAYVAFTISRLGGYEAGRLSGPA